MTKVIQHPSLCRDCVPCLQIVLRGGMTTWHRHSGRVAISNISFTPAQAWKVKGQGSQTCCVLLPLETHQTL
jgi:hypothetical protein